MLCVWQVIEKKTKKDEGYGTSRASKQEQQEGKGEAGGKGETLGKGRSCELYKEREEAARTGGCDVLNCKGRAIAPSGRTLGSAGKAQTAKRKR